MRFFGTLCCPRRFSFLLLAVATMFCIPPTADGQTKLKNTDPVTAAEVDAEVARLIDSLWQAQQADGSWKENHSAAPGPKELGPIANKGGCTALIMLALKVANPEHENDPRFQKGLTWLAAQPGTGTYFRGLRATLYSQLRDEKIKPRLFADADLLTQSVRGKSGMYLYTPPAWPHDKAKQATATGGDFSNTQYGILGLWAATDRDYELDNRYWKLFEETYVKALCPGGGWGYKSNAKKPTITMTAAGIATLYVIWEKLYIVNDPKCANTVNPELVKALSSSLDWMGKNFVTYKQCYGGWGYYHYGIERIGVASGLKYFGEHDWFKEMVFDMVRNNRRPSGDINAAWALLFYCYGRAPVIFNKLQYGAGQDWNQRPREYAMLCRWLSKAYERHHNWQIMPLSGPAQDFHDAPILSMSGKAAFQFKDDEIDKIRQYILRGGTLYGEAVSGSAAFTRAFEALCTKLFPKLELSPLPPAHPVYSSHFDLKGQPRLLGLSDNVRTLVIFSPNDLSCDWQRLNIRNKTNFEIAANIVQYTVDRGRMWSKEESYWPADYGKKPSASVTIGRLIHGEAASEHVWNPTGTTGWERLDILSRNGGGAGVATQNVDLATPIQPSKIPVLHVTGTSKISLSAEAKANLKAYVQAGGLVFADAAGGKTEFSDSFNETCAELFGSKPTQLSDMPFLAGQEQTVWYRHRGQLPRVKRPLDMLGLKVKQADGKESLNVLVIPWDVTYALVGSPASDPVGLEPNDATRISQAIINWRASAKLAVPTKAGS